MQNIYNRNRFQECTAADFKDKGIYPLNKNSWWLAQPAEGEITGNETSESNNKNCRYWYCAGCGG
eukprot:6829496-Prorocentrum_lima.AAC.1